METSNQANDCEDDFVSIVKYTACLMGLKCMSAKDLQNVDICRRQEYKFEMVLKFKGILPKKLKKYNQLKHADEWIAKLMKAYHDNIHMMELENDDGITLK